MPTQPYINAAGEKVTGVTTIISTNLGWNKNALMAWTRKLALQGVDPFKVRDSAAGIGTLVHDALDHYCNGKDFDYSSTSFDDSVVVRNAVDKFDEFVRNNNIEFVETEAPFVNEEYQYGGCFDAIIKDKDGDHFLLDFKTSNAVYSDHIVQLSAYREDVKKRYDIKGGVLVHIEKEPDMSSGGDTIHIYQVTNEELDEAFDVFKDLLHLHKTKGRLDGICKKMASK
jgi:hypothetical protein